MPLHRWLCVHDDARGATLLSDGLAEGEAHDGRLAVTLLRAVGELSRHDLPERPGHAGWPCAIPGAQVQGRFSARVGLVLHGPWSDETLGTIEDAADALLLPLVGESWRDLEGASRALDGPRLSGDGLRASAVQVSADGEAVMLRAVNITQEAREGAWTLPAVGAWRWRECRLDGTTLGAWQHTDASIAFDAGARAVVTVEVRRDDEGDGG